MSSRQHLDKRSRSRWLSKAQPRGMNSRLIDRASTPEWPFTIQPKALLDAHPVSLLWSTLIIAVLLISVRLYQGSRHNSKATVLSKVTANEAFRIEPIKDFKLNSTKPPVFRPFKPKYHLTMGMFQEPDDLSPNNH